MEPTKSLQSHTFQAFLATLAALGAGVAAQRWGIQIPPGVLESLAGAFVVYVLGRQYKSTKLELARKEVAGTIAGLDSSELAQTIAEAVADLLAKRPA